MRLEPGFISTLRDQFSSLPLDVRDHVNQEHGLNEQELLSLVSRPEEQSALYVEDAQKHDLINYDPDSFSSIGIDAIENGQVVSCILAGGAGTRIGQPKALTKFSNGLSLLALKMMQTHHAVSTIMMINKSIRDDVINHVCNLTLNVQEFGAFEQFEGYRLTPDNRLSFFNDQVELAPTGHGDLAVAMLCSGMMDELLKRGIKYVFVSNVDNVLATIDPTIIGHHIASKKHVTFLATERKLSDQGGIVAWVDGQLQAIEQFRLPYDYDTKNSFHNTNSFVVDIDALADSSIKKWRWHRVRKSVNNRIVIQYERLIQQLTEFYDTAFVKVPRDSHYMPIKEQEDIENAERFLFKDPFKK